MSALLYYSISSDLTEDEIIKIDSQVINNRETVCRFVINIPSNIKDKSKRLIIVISLATLVCFSGLESADPIGLPMAPAPVVRVQPSFEDSFKHADIAKLVPPKPDHISYKYLSKSKEELLLLIYATDPRLGSNQEVLKLVKELRGGRLVIVGTAAFLGLIILIFSMGEGFVRNNQNPGWGLNRPNPFQPPTAEHRYPPYYDLFFPKGTCYGDRPGGLRLCLE